MLKSSKEAIACVLLLPSPPESQPGGWGDGKPALCPVAIQGQDHVPQVGGALPCSQPRPEDNSSCGRASALQHRETCQPHSRECPHRPCVLTPPHATLCIRRTYKHCQASSKWEAVTLVTPPARRIVVPPSPAATHTHTRNGATKAREHEGLLHPRLHAWRPSGMISMVLGPASLGLVFWLRCLARSAGTEPSRPQLPPLTRSGKKELHPAQGRSLGHLPSLQEQM